MKYNITMYRFVPYLTFRDGDNAFKMPPFWFRSVGKSVNKLGIDYYLFPINLFIRLKRRLYVKKEKKIDRG
jgi:hypothetical protein